MTKEEIDKLLNDLDWNHEKRKDAFEKLKEIKDLSVLIGPKECKRLSKTKWDNCAMILFYKSDLELLPYIDDLFIWLQDMNWPGAIIIFKRLQNFSKELIANNYNKIKEKAKVLNDKIWLDNLQDLYENTDEYEEMIKYTFNEWNRNMK